jgi:hypothetical protein
MDGKRRRKERGKGIGRGEGIPKGKASHFLSDASFSSTLNKPSSFIAGSNEDWHDPHGQKNSW